MLLGGQPKLLTNFYGRDELNLKSTTQDRSVSDSGCHFCNMEKITATAYLGRKGLSLSLSNCTDIGSQRLFY